LLLAPFAFAHEHEEELAEGKRLVDAKAPCSDLSDEQLEAVGEYVMETMHPGEAHDAMHEMMGVGEGTPEHESFHINIARHMYCGRGYGMMGGMMGPNMMKGQSMGPGMIGGGQMMGWSGMWGIGSVLWTLILVGLVLIVWLWVIKLLRNVFGRKK